MSHGAQRHGGAPLLAQAGAASAFACSPFALVPPQSMHAWPRTDEVPRLFLSRNVPPSHQPQHPHTKHAAIAPPNSLETLNAARPQHVAMRSTPDEPEPPLPRDPMTSFSSNNGAVNDDDLFRGGRALVPNSMDSVSTRAAQTHRSQLSARGMCRPPEHALSTPTDASRDDDYQPSSATTVNPYLPLYPGAREHVTLSAAMRGTPAVIPPPLESAAAADRTKHVAMHEQPHGGGASAAARPGQAVDVMLGDGGLDGQFNSSMELSEAGAAFDGPPASAPEMLVIGATVGASLNRAPEDAPFGAAISRPPAPAGDLTEPERLTAPPPQLSHPHRGDGGLPAGLVQSSAIGASAAIHSDSGTATDGSRMYSREHDHPRAAAASARTLGLQSSPGSTAGTAHPARPTADAGSPMPPYGAAPPALKRLSASTPKLLLEGAPDARSHSTPPSSGPPSSSLGSPTPLEQLLPAHRQVQLHSLSADGQPSVGTLATVTFAAMGGSGGVSGGGAPASGDTTPGSQTPANAPDLCPPGLAGTASGDQTAILSLPHATDAIDLTQRRPPAGATSRLKQAAPGSTDAGADPGARGSAPAHTPHAVGDAEAAGDRAEQRRWDLRSSSGKVALKDGQTRHVQVFTADLDDLETTEATDVLLRPGRGSSRAESKGAPQPRGARKPRGLLSVCCMAPQATRA